MPRSQARYVLSGDTRMEESGLLRASDKINIATSERKERNVHQRSNRTSAKEQQNGGATRGEREHALQLYPVGLKHALSLFVSCCVVRVLVCALCGLNTGERFSPSAQK